jgi:hypothetical protein
MCKTSSGVILKLDSTSRCVLTLTVLLDEVRGLNGVVTGSHYYCRLVANHLNNGLFGVLSAIDTASRC